MSEILVDSAFCLLDVKMGTKDLVLAARHGTRVLFKIEATLDSDPGSIGNWDGTSREFGLLVEKVTAHVDD